MIYLADKSPGDVSDYNLNFDEFVPDAFALDHVEVVVTQAGNTESPISLQVVGEASIQPDSAEDDAPDKTILFWLEGGTPDTRYRGTITLSDNESADPDRVYVREFEIYVKQL